MSKDNGGGGGELAVPLIVIVGGIATAFMVPVEVLLPLGAVLAGLAATVVRKK